MSYSVTSTNGNYNIYTEQELIGILHNDFGYVKDGRVLAIIQEAKKSDIPIYINRNLKNKFFGILKIYFKQDINSFILENKRYSSIAQAKEHGLNGIYL